VGFLVHDQAGLMVSFRGALALNYRIDLPATPDAAPCVECEAPCLIACPVNALSPHGYDTDAATAISTPMPEPIAWIAAAPYAGHAH
jgi:epoxyqueuosine reductase